MLRSFKEKLFGKPKTYTSRGTSQICYGEFNVWIENHPYICEMLWDKEDKWYKLVVYGLTLGELSKYLSAESHKVIEEIFNYAADSRVTIFLFQSVEELDKEIEMLTNTMNDLDDSGAAWVRRLLHERSGFYPNRMRFWRGFAAALVRARDQVNDR